MAQRLNGRQAKDAFADRGHRGITQYKGTANHVPVPDKNITKAKRKKHSRRAAIEPVTGHFKTRLPALPQLPQRYYWR